MNRQWWKEAVVYQVYPRSFMDSNGDGIGDIEGLIAKVGYLKELGVDVVWLSPVYCSPNADNGYDISDYREILPAFGDMDTIDRLITELHSHGMKLVMDLIVNHTSDEHMWFVEARKGKDNPFRAYYIWKDGVEGDLPNNWESHFSGPAWEYDRESGQYYLHIFSKKQPDLNWENPNVRREVQEIAQFWLTRGIDGFRMDVINFVSKTPGFPAVPGARGLTRGHQFYMNGPRVHEYLRELNEAVLSQYDIMTVGETPNVTPADALDYVGEERRELNMVFQFAHMNVDSGARNKWDIVPWNFKNLKGILSKWQRELYGKGWNSLYLSNHDQPRQVSRFGNDTRYHAKSAKLLATMIHTLQGTPYIYQGEEIGMTNVRFADLSEYRDIQTLNLYADLSAQGIPHADIMEKIYYRGRDNARTPMQWDETENAGFTDGTPWLAVNPNHTSINVRAQREDPDSVWNYYKRLIALRKEHPVIIYGDFTEYFADSDRLYAYRRSLDDIDLFVLLNFSATEPTVTLPDCVEVGRASVLVSNYADAVPGRVYALRPYEAIVFSQSNR